MTDGEVLDRFAEEYQVYHAISNDRCKIQLNQLRDFARHAGVDLIDASGSEFSRWMGSLVGKGLKPTTVQKYGNMVRPFYTWAFSAGLVTGDQLMSIKAVSNPNGANDAVPRPYKPWQARRFYRDLDARYPLVPDERLRRFQRKGARYRAVGSHYQNVQLRAIVGLALYCGLRRREIFDLTINDMHHDNLYVVVREGKGGKYREVPHVKRSREAVKAWLDLRDDLDPPHERPWLSAAPSQPEGHWSRAMSWDRFRSQLRSIPANRYSLHRFRHTCATTWLRAGMPVQIVSKLLGHASLQMTMRYTEIVRDDIHASAAEHQDRFDMLLDEELQRPSRERTPSGTPS